MNEYIFIIESQRRDDPAKWEPTMVNYDTFNHAKAHMRVNERLVPEVKWRIVSYKRVGVKGDSDA